MVLHLFSILSQGTTPINALVTGIDVPADKDSGKYKIHYSRYSEGSKKGVKEDDEFDLVIGSDGANSRVAKVPLIDRCWVARKCGKRTFFR